MNKAVVPTRRCCDDSVRRTNSKASGTGRSEAEARSVLCWAATGVGAYPDGQLHASDYRLQFGALWRSYRVVYVYRV